MKAELVIRERRVLSTGFIEVVVWRLSEPLSASVHAFKYRLAYVVDGRCVLRCDNESGKGDHKHVGGREMRYRFRSIDQLLDDFLSDVSSWEGE